jgi:hypothetical protein
MLGALLALVALRFMDPSVPLHLMEPAFEPAILILGGALCAVGLVGVCGACLASRPTLCAYGVSTLLVAITAFIASGILLATVNGHGEEIASSCALQGSTGQMWSKIATKYQASYDSMRQALVNCRKNGRPTALGLQDCGQLGKDSAGNWYLEDPLQPLFQWIERASGCGGFCVGDLPLFAYPAKPGGDPSAVDQSTKQKRRNPCYQQLVDRLEATGDQSAGMVIALAVPLLFAVCGALWIVCYPPPRSRKGYVHPEVHSPYGRGESGHLLYGGPSETYNSDEEEEDDYAE